jgi:hypothetical protein
LAKSTRPTRQKGLGRIDLVLLRDNTLAHARASLLRRADSRCPGALRPR